MTSKGTSLNISRKRQLCVLDKWFRGHWKETQTLFLYFVRRASLAEFLPVHPDEEETQRMKHLAGFKGPQLCLQPLWLARAWELLAHSWPAPRDPLQSSQMHQHGSGTWDALILAAPPGCRKGTSLHRFPSPAALWLLLERWSSLPEAPKL